MDQPMSPRLERLYLAAVQSGWWLDWQRYYAAEEAERDARDSLAQYLRTTAPLGEPVTIEIEEG